MRSVAATMIALLLSCDSCGSGESDVLLATTTSTYDSGLLDVLGPMFEESSGTTLKVVAVGSGQAMAMGRRGEADVLLVHSPAAEEAFMREGHGSRRRRVMHNDFVLVGPASDPAGIGVEEDVPGAFRALAASRSLFVSRGDDSGTHARERLLWRKAGVDPSGRWYIETGLGMGGTLSVASEKGGYTLVDRGTYLALRENLHLEIIVEGDPLLHNVYHVIELSRERFPGANHEGAAAFAEFLLSGEAQEAIRVFGTQEYGTALFHPDAAKM